jgi:hypothetical protein
MTYRGSLLEWIDIHIDGIQLEYILENPHPDALDLFFHYIPIGDSIPDLYWPLLSRHSHAIPLLKKRPHRIDFKELQKNTHPDAIVLLRKYYEPFLNIPLIDPSYHLPDHIPFNAIFQNPAAMDFINEIALHAPKKMYWSMLCMNPHPEAIRLLEANIDKIEWYFLSSNPSAIDLLYKYPDKIHYPKFWENPNNKELEKYAYDFLYNDKRVFKERSIQLNSFHFGLFIECICKNTNPIVIDMIDFMLDEMYMDIHEHIHWAFLSANPSAIGILEKHPSCIVWYEFLKNPAIFNTNEKVVLK